MKVIHITSILEDDAPYEALEMPGRWCLDVTDLKYADLAHLLDDLGVTEVERRDDETGFSEVLTLAEFKAWMTRDE